MSNLNDLLAQIAALQLQADAIKSHERNEALATVNELVNKFSFSSQEIFGLGTKKSALPGGVKKVTAKYRDPQTGATWSGRGLTPKWLKGKDLAEFLISK